VSFPGGAQRTVAALVATAGPGDAARVGLAADGGVELVLVGPD
jgi:hypothetical protein